MRAPTLEDVAHGSAKATIDLAEIVETAKEGQKRRKTL